ncbi:uncharacterized protein ehbp1l1a isoform X2 [Girardinichthys multiradiatus]|uniref:uncharacterized protein ehbp1l1a isoform X2 n=1 Tax=Girardinichthys multiradiatus TaxID=208333 RepID=UPI001FAD2CC6|nr:uncharacterized protein ehbp1l1a isoform X2 [Girardinichthys multiradiatus]
MWHSSPDVPLLLTGNGSPVVQGETDEDTVVKETDTNEVTAERPGHLSAGEPNDFFPIETFSCGAVEQACARHSEHGYKNTVSQQPPYPIFTESDDLLSQTQRAITPHQSQNAPVVRTMKWQEPKARTWKCPSNREELPSVSPQEMAETELIKETVVSAQSVSPSSELDVDDNETIKREKEAEMEDQLPFCQTVENELKIIEIPNNEYDLQSQGHETQTEDERSLGPSVCYVPHYPRPESYSKQCILLETCSRMTNVTGMPCISQSCDEKLWPIHQMTIWKKELQMNEKRLQLASEENKNHEKESVLMTPCCPRQARIPGFSSLSQKSGKSHYCAKLSKKQTASQRELILNKKKETEHFTIVVSPKEDSEAEQKIAPGVLKHSYIPDVTSIVPTSVPSEGSDITILGSCPKSSSIEGIPSLVNHNFNERWITEYKPFAVTDLEVCTVKIKDRCCIEGAIKGMTILTPTCPKQARAPGFPSALECIIIYIGFSEVKLVPSCPSVTRMAGFPSVEKADSKDWEANHKPFWEKLIMNKSPVLLKNNKVKKKFKRSVSLSLSCPSESLIPGFPSKVKPRVTDIETSMVALLSSCSTSKEPLFEPRMKNKQLLHIDNCERDKRKVKGMVSILSSSPKVSSIRGFPSVPHLKLDYYETNIVSLLPLCPVTSSIPGFPSLEQPNEGWPADVGPLMCGSQRTGQFSTELLPSNTDKSKDMLCLALSCARESLILGFASIPKPRVTDTEKRGMVSLLSSCPKISRIAGFPSFHSPELWTISKEPLFEAQMKDKQLLHIDFCGRGKRPVKGMVSILPSCPRVSRIEGFPTVPFPKLDYYGTNIVSVLPLCPVTSNIPGFHSLEQPNEGWPADVGPLMYGSQRTAQFSIELLPSNTDQSKDMLCLALSCARESLIPGFASIPKPRVTDTEKRCMVSLLSSCPKISRIAGFPSFHSPELWTVSKEPLFEAQMKDKQLLHIDFCGRGKRPVKGMVSILPSCPRVSRIEGFPNVPFPKLDYYGPNIVSLLPLCPVTSSIPGFPSLEQPNEGWPADVGPLMYGSQRTAQFSTGLLPSNTDKSKDMLCLALSCARESLIPGFASIPKPRVTDTEKRGMVSLSSSCPKISRIAGFPSFHSPKLWTVSKEPLFEAWMKDKQLLHFDFCGRGKRPVKEMVSILPSCPRVSRIKGFPTVPFPKLDYYGTNIVSVLPLCPVTSSIPGFPSMEQQNEGWATDVGSFMYGSQRTAQFSPKLWTGRKESLFEAQMKNKHLFLIDHCDKDKRQVKGMVSLLPSCPKISSIKGFASVPHPKLEYYRLNVFSLLPLCPVTSSIPGFPSLEQQNEEVWADGLGSLMYKSQRTVQFPFDFSPSNTAKTEDMLCLVPACPKESLIHGFPSITQCIMSSLKPEEPSKPILKSSMEPNMKNVVPCCSSTSGIRGFASLTTVPSTEWLSDMKPILMKPQVKHKIISIPEQEQLDFYSRKGMLALVTSCPKKTRIYGFASAQKVNKPPDMVSLYTSSPCVSVVPGFPSARRLSSECAETHTWKTKNVVLFEKKQKEKTLTAIFPGLLHLTQEINCMVTIASPCPRMAVIPGFTNFLQVKTTDVKKMGTSQLSPTETHSQSTLKAKRRNVPLSSVRRQSTELSNEQKGGAKQSVDHFLYNGKSHVERIVAGETQTGNKSLDTSEAVGLFGWEVLEADGSVFEKQRERHLSANAEETSGLVKTLVSVFHKG